jgi:putative flippase GtrA
MPDAKSAPTRSSTPFSRYVRFNVVGIAGFAVQLSTLALLVHVAGVWYVLGTALAVEAAVLHNFAWHERWTWRDRPRGGRVFDRLVGFHATNGLTSLAAHVVGTPLLVEVAGLSPLGANVLLVGLLSLVNYQLGDRVVFTDRPAP